MSQFARKVRRTNEQRRDRQEMSRQQRKGDRAVRRLIADPRPWKVHK